MIDIDEICSATQEMAQKQQHGVISPKEFNRYANLASIDLFNQKIGSTRDFYQLGKAIPKMTPGMDKQVDQDLKPFLVSDTVIAVTSGQANIPSNCEFIDSVVVTSASLPVKWVPKNKVASYLKSTIDVPTEEYPIYTDLPSTIQIYPSLPSIKVSYYKTPSTVVWNYTVVAGKPVYNPTGSVNFEWFPTQKLELITRILGYIGISIRDSELTQYANIEENTIS